MGLPTRALSLRQPYAFFVLDPRCTHPKRIENRGVLIKTWAAWEEPYFWIHASKNSEEAYWTEALRLARSEFGDALGLPRSTDLPRGGIVGRARIIGTVDPYGKTTFAEGVTPPELDMRWHHRGSQAYILDEAKPCAFVECRGAQGFFKVPLDVLGVLVHNEENAARGRISHV